jgi:phosphate transport system substrate-binding protein
MIASSLRFILAAACLAIALSAPLDADSGSDVKGVDPRLPSFQPVGEIHGSIRSAGADALLNLMMLWRERFVSLYPGVTVEFGGRGGSTPLGVLLNDRCDFALASRPLRAEEIKEVAARHNGTPPTAMRVALDVLTIFVHKDNPIAAKGLTLTQLDAIYSSTRKLGHPDDIATWGDLGLQGDWAKQPIRLLGRNAAASHYAYFRWLVLGREGLFKDSVIELPGSRRIIAAIAEDRFAIGYSGFGYKTDDVVAVPIISVDGRPIHPDAQPIDAYPLHRYLLIYVNHNPGDSIPQARSEFLRYIYSREGQAEVLRDGYQPIPGEIAREDLARIGIELKLAAEAEPAGTRGEAVLRHAEPGVGADSR